MVCFFLNILFTSVIYILRKHFVLRSMYFALNLYVIFIILRNSVRVHIMVADLFFIFSVLVVATGHVRNYETHI